MCEQGRQDLDWCLISKQAGGQRGSAALKDAMADWRTVYRQVCTHSLIPEGGWQQTWGEGYSLLHLGGGLTSTYKHITCQTAIQDLFLIIFNILRTIVKIIVSNRPSEAMVSYLTETAVLRNSLACWRAESGSFGIRVAILVCFSFIIGEQ